jgi:hypothetical protein
MSIVTGTVYTMNADIAEKMIYVQQVFPAEGAFIYSHQ